MRYKKLDLNLLVALNALLTERSVTRAGERVFLSQSTMSNALARLREYFDDELLVQVGSKLELTPRAEILHEAVLDVLLRIDTSITTQPEFNPTESDREFILLISDYTMEILLPHMLALVSEQGSKVSFQLKRQTGDPARTLERGEADLLLIPKAYCSDDHPRELLFEEDYVCVLWKDNALAQEELTLERYIEADHAVMHPDENTPSAFESVLMTRSGISRHIGLSTYSFAALPSLVVGTEMIATVHARLAKRMQPLLPIALRPVPLPMPPLELAMQWHKYRSQDPALIWLRSVMHQAVERLQLFDQCSAEET